MQNRDDECLKWALRAALFPPKDGKHAERPSKYPVNDGIDYKGIDFPTPVKKIDKLEAQNRNLAINVFDWENNCVTVHRISNKEANVPRINLMLIESGIIQHYCYVKRVSALLFDQTKNSNAKHYCMLCLTGFSREDFLENHKKIFQCCERQADKDRNAGRGEKHPFFPKSSQTDEGPLRDLCGF